MKIWQFVTVITILAISAGANASLLGRDLDGNVATVEAYYDDIANLTWLADANYAQSSGFDSDGLMSWYDASDWAASLNFSGVTGWRLANTVYPDSSCSVSARSGINCSGSELGNLFYNVLGGSASNSIAVVHNDNYELFSNIQSGPRSYWSATTYGDSRLNAFLFRFTSGYQDYAATANSHYAWAVNSGDVGVAVVPVPAAIWLFGSGLIGLIGLVKRKKS